MRFELDNNASNRAMARKEPPVQGQEFRDLSPLESPSSEVLDREAFHTSAGGDPSALLELVTRFLAESRTMLEKLRHGINLGDAPALEEGAHRLGGSLRAVAATAACTAALHLEAVARVGNLEQAEEVLFRLEDEITRLEPQLTSLQYK